MHQLYQAQIAQERFHQFQDHAQQSDPKPFNQLKELAHE
jgi:hypothetical protein